MMKEKLLSALGTFGGILWYILQLVLFVLPLVMIHQGLLLRAVFFFCMGFKRPEVRIFSLGPKRAGIC